MGYHTLQKKILGYLDYRPLNNSGATESKGAERTLYSDNLNISAVTALVLYPPTPRRRHLCVEVLHRMLPFPGSVSYQGGAVGWSLPAATTISSAY